jgi:hypothetical protein
LPRLRQGDCMARSLLSGPVFPSIAMPTKPSVASAPLTFDLPLPLIAKLEMLRKKTGLASTSEVVRLALREFDFGNYQPVVSEHRQISVRLAPQLRKYLTQTARKKQVSLGELLRVSLEGLAETKARK